MPLYILQTSHFSMQGSAIWKPVMRSRMCRKVYRNLFRNVSFKRYVGKKFLNICKVRQKASGRITVTCFLYVQIILLCFSDGKLFYQLFQMNRIVSCRRCQIFDIGRIAGDFIGVLCNRLTAFGSHIALRRDITDRRIHLIQTAENLI